MDRPRGWRRVTPSAAWICAQLLSEFPSLRDRYDSCRIGRELVGKARDRIVFPGKNDAMLGHNGCKIRATVQVSRGQVASRFDAIQSDVAGDGVVSLADEVCRASWRGREQISVV